jgi:hypothetical protein
MASAFASASPDALMQLPPREAAAPFGQRQSRSLPHTLPGVWFVPFGTVPAAAGQATPCPAGHSAFGGRCHLFEAAACAAGYRARLYSLALPRPLPRPSSFRLLRRLHRASLHSMFARLAHWVHLPNADDYNSTFPRSRFSGLVRPYGECFAVLSALIRSLPLGLPLRAELSFSLPKPFPRLYFRQSLIYYGSLCPIFYMRLGALRQKLHIHPLKIAGSPS